MNNIQQQSTQYNNNFNTTESINYLEDPMHDAHNNPTELSPIQIQVEQCRQLMSQFGGQRQVDKEKIKMKSSGRSYVVRKDQRKKYILMNKERVYLSEIKGKYVYI